MNIEDLESILLSCTKINLPINHIIYKEGDKADEIYFLKSGVVEV